jgi:exosortase
MKKLFLPLLIGSGAMLFGLLYCPTFAWLYERYTAADSYYTHGFIIPFITGYLIRLKWNELKTVRCEYSGSGLILVVAALLVHLFSMLSGVYFLSGYSLLVLSFGVSLYLFGKEFTRKIAFALLFLFFMFPLPLTAINAVSFPMRLYATKVSVAVLSTAGIPVYSEGFRIIFPGDSLVVGSPCSGLRSLISMIALGSVFAHLSNAGKWLKLSLVIIAVPIALLSNIVRLMVLCMGAYKFGSGAIHGFVHDVTGYAAFIIAFGMLWYTWKELNRHQGKRYGSV